MRKRRKRRRRSNNMESRNRTKSSSSRRGEGKASSRKGKRDNGAGTPDGRGRKAVGGRVEKYDQVGAGWGGGRP